MSSDQQPAAVRTVACESPPTQSVGPRSACRDRPPTAAAVHHTIGLRQPRVGAASQIASCKERFRRETECVAPLTRLTAISFVGRGIDG